MSQGSLPSGDPFDQANNESVSQLCLGEIDFLCDSLEIAFSVMTVKTWKRLQCHLRNISLLCLISGYQELSSLSFKGLKVYRKGRMLHLKTPLLHCISPRREVPWDVTNPPSPQIWNRLGVEDPEGEWVCRRPMFFSIFAVRVTAVSEGGNGQEQGGRLDVSGCCEF